MKGPLAACGISQPSLTAWHMPPLRHPRDMDPSSGPCLHSGDTPPIQSLMPELSVLLGSFSSSLHPFPHRLLEAHDSAFSPEPDTDPSLFIFTALAAQAPPLAWTAMKLERSPTPTLPRPPPLLLLLATIHCSESASQTRSLGGSVS